MNAAVALSTAPSAPGICAIVLLTTSRKATARDSRLERAVRPAVDGGQQHGSDRQPEREALGMQRAQEEQGLLAVDCRAPQRRAAAGSDAARSNSACRSCTGCAPPAAAPPRSRSSRRPRTTDRRSGPRWPSSTFRPRPCRPAARRPRECPPRRRAGAAGHAAATNACRCISSGEPRSLNGKSAASRIQNNGAPPRAVEQAEDAVPPALGDQEALVAETGDVAADILLPP